MSRSNREQQPALPAWQVAQAKALSAVGATAFGGPHYLFEGGRLAKGALVRRSTALVHAPGEPAEEETEHEHGDEGDDSDQRFNCHAITSPYARSVAGRIGPELALGTLDPWTSAARQARASRMSASVTASGATAMWRCRAPRISSTGHPRPLASAAASL